MTTMTKEKAMQMLADGILAMVEVGEMKCAQSTIFRTEVLGKTVTASCVMFADSQDVLTALSTRLTTNPSLSQDALERLAVDNSVPSTDTPMLSYLNSKPTIAHS